jgi:hypothetical protein
MVEKMYKPMTVGELISFLQTVDPNLPVYECREGDFRGVTRGDVGEGSANPEETDEDDDEDPKDNDWVPAVVFTAFS